MTTKYASVVTAALLAVLIFTLNLNTLCAAEPQPDKKEATPEEVAAAVDKTTAKMKDLLETVRSLTPPSAMDKEVSALTQIKLPAIETTNAACVADLADAFVESLAADLKKEVVRRLEKKVISDSDLFEIKMLLCSASNTVHKANFHARLAVARTRLERARDAQYDSVVVSKYEMLEGVDFRELIKRTETSWGKQEVLLFKISQQVQVIEDVQKISENLAFVLPREKISELSKKVLNKNMVKWF